MQAKRIGIRARRILLGALGVLALGSAGCEPVDPAPVATTAATGVTTATGAPVDPPGAPPEANPGDAKAALSADLKALAVLAGKLLDGDECRAVLTERTYATMWRVDPRDQWAAADNYDYDEEIAIRVKKLLIRLARTRSYKADCNLWLDCPEKENTVQCVIKQVNNCCPYAPWGALSQPTPEIIKKALEGEVVVGYPDGDRVSAFAPIQNSMGDIVGVVECSSRVEFFQAAVQK